MSHNEAQARLKAACYDYYTTQQLLVKAEDEHIQLRAIIQQLEGQVQQHLEEARRIASSKQAIDEERDRESALPAGVPVAAFDAFVTEERRLLAESAQAQDEMTLYEEEIEDLERHVARESKSAVVLENALDAQVQFSHVLRASAKQGGAKIDNEHSRQAVSVGRRHTLETELAQLQKREHALARVVRAGANDRQKVQEILQERDSDVVRLRRDAAFTRRLYMGELEFAREQEAQLQQLTTENRRLKATVEVRRAGRPSMRPPAPDSSPRHADPCRAEATSYTGGVPKRKELVVESNDEVENVLHEMSAAETGRKKPKPSPLDRVREVNLALLQQMVATMQALRVAVEPTQG
jgi:chromosome segregation ATPase